MHTASTTPIAKAAARPTAKTRLLGMLVQEVSLVDAAANLRKFLVIKRATPMAIKVKKDGEAAGTETEKAPEATDPAAAEGSMQAQVKDSLMQALAQVAEKVVTTADLVKDLPVSEQPVNPAVPQPVLGAVGEATSMLQAIVTQFADAAAPPDAATAAATTGAAGEAKAAAGAAPAAVTAPAVPPLEAAATLAKAGRKMAKERYARFSKAIDMLAGILKELSVEAQRKSASGAPAAPAGVTLSAKEAKNLHATMFELSEVVKAQAATIARLEKATGAASSTPVETPPARVEKGAVSWPMDLNAPTKKT